MNIVRNKVIFTFSTFFILYLLVLGRAFYIQVIARDKLISYSDNQFLRTEKIYPNRGQILDRNGNPLAINIQTYNIFTIPKGSNSVASLKELKKIVKDFDVNNAIKLVKSRKKFTWLARKIKISIDDVEKIKKIPGIYIESQPSRYYPNHELLAQTLGFVGIDNGGLSGLEYVFDEQLRGKAMMVRYMKDAKGRAIKRETVNLETKASDVYLSIDKDIQAVVEMNLKDAVIKHNALKAGAGVIDATTGEIWAIANYPSFDPNANVKGPVDNRKLAFISDPFEPGSIFKTLTIASALEHGVATLKSNYFCENGYLQIGKHTIKEAHAKKYKWLSVAEILKHSSNIGTTKIAFDLGAKNFFKTLQDFGFGHKTGIAIPSESRGILDYDQKMSQIRLSNISFGQGVAATGLQMLTSYAAIANEGKLMQPTIVRQDTTDPLLGKQVLRPEVARDLRDMLLDVVEDGTGKMARIDHYLIAGKTSTAQKPSPQGGYSGYISGFIGFPVNVKRSFVVFVYVDDPKSNGFYGGEVAGPLFRNIVKAILYKNREFSDLAQSFNPEGASVDSIKISSAASRYAGEGRVPNFIGMDKVSASKLADDLNIKIEMNGFGVCQTQYPEAGVPLSEKQVINLKFKAPNYE
jgi:cell division protein FtsI (penicillin-binding protein 3)